MHVLVFYPLLKYYCVWLKQLNLLLSFNSTTKLDALYKNTYWYFSPKHSKEITNINKINVLEVNLRIELLHPVRRAASNSDHLRCRKYEFEHVKEFNYIGSQLNQTNSTSSEIQARILNGNGCYYALWEINEMKSVK